jgi:hypothetical protein
MPRQTNNNPVPSIFEVIMGSLTLLMLLATLHFLSFIL